PEKAAAIRGSRRVAAGSKTCLPARDRSSSAARPPTARRRESTRPDPAAARVRREDPRRGSPRRRVARCANASPRRAEAPVSRDPSRNMRASSEEWRTRTRRPASGRTARACAGTRASNRSGGSESPETHARHVVQRTSTSVVSIALVSRCPCRENSGVLPRIKLVPHVVRAAVAVEQRSEYHCEETERYRHETRIAQLEQRLLEADDRSLVVLELVEVGLGK